MRVILLVLLMIACADSNKTLGIDSLKGSVEEVQIRRKRFIDRTGESSDEAIVDDVESRTYSINEAKLNDRIIDALFRTGINSIKVQQHQFSSEHGGGRPKRQAVKNDTISLLWNSRVIPYSFDPEFSKRGKSAFRKAAKLWTSLTCLNITELPDDDDDDDDDVEEDGGDDDEYEYSEYPEELDEEEENQDSDYIFVSNRNECASSVGRKGGFQPISLGSRCQTIGTAAHELGHALGLIHTLARRDRDEYITVNWTNIDIGEKYTSQFEEHNNESSDTYGLPYDYGSVMHYGSTAGSINRTKQTMMPKDGLYRRTLGSLLVSFYDLLLMNMLYSCTEICKNYTSTKCQNGGFPHPRNCSKCICPTGYGGDFCDEKPPNLCGEKLNATTNWTKLITSSDMTYGGEDGYKRCVYWLSAPNGSNIEVKLMKLPENVTADGCIYAGVEIKARQDQRLTGYRFCSKDDVNTTLISNSSTVPVITYSRRRRNATGTELQFRIARGNDGEGEEES